MLLIDSWYLTTVSHWPNSCDTRPMRLWLFILHPFSWFTFTHNVWYMLQAAAFHRSLRSSSLIYQQKIIAHYSAAKVQCSTVRKDVTKFRFKCFQINAHSPDPKSVRFLALISSSTNLWFFIVFNSTLSKVLTRYISQITDAVKQRKCPLLQNKTYTTAWLVVFTIVVW